MEELRHLVEMRKKHPEADLVLLTVHVNYGNDPDLTREAIKTSALNYLKKINADFTNVLLELPDKEWQERLNLNGLPGSFVFNREGKWEKKYKDKFDPKELESLLTDLLKR
jgi:hypothetical protein